MASSSSSTAPSVSASSAPSQSHGSSTTNLYLVTFLATLFLLLFVSCAIVLRSYVLRQRYNRRLNEAMAAGLFLAPHAQGSKRKRFGVRPKFVDTWIAAGGPKWQRITPLSAQSIMVKRRLRDGHVPRLPLPPGASFDPSSPDPASIFSTLAEGSPAALTPHANANAQLNTQNTLTLRSRLAGLFSPQQHRRAASGAEDDEQEGDGIPLVAAPLPNASAVSVPLLSPVSPIQGGAGAPSTPKAPSGYKIRVEMLQVAVLIAMPSPSRLQRKNARLDRYGHGVEEDPLSSEDEADDDDEETRKPLPELVLGVARVRYPASGAIKAQARPRGVPAGAGATAAAAAAATALEVDALRDASLEEEELSEEEDAVLDGEDAEPPVDGVLRPPVVLD